MNDLGKNEKYRVGTVGADEGSDAEKTRRAKKPKVTALDFMILLLIVLCVVGIIFRSVIANFFIRSVPTENIEISFMAENLTQDEVALVKEGDALYLDEEIFGEITGLSASSSKNVVLSSDDSGNPVFTEAVDPERYTINGSISVSGRYNGEGFASEDNVQLHVGKILNIYASSYNLTVIITEIPQN